MRKIDLLGCLIGDAYISEKGCLTIRHSVKQREYIEYKYNLCKKLYIGRNFNLVDVPSQNAIQFGISDRKTFMLWRKWYYPNGKKYITRKWLDRLTVQAISFWFCDDGSMSYKKKNGKITAIESTISTCCSYTEAKAVCDYFFDKWKIVMTVRKMGNHFSVRFGTKASRVFVEFFGDKIPQCMSYKTDKLIDFSGCYVN